jgi:S-adenosylmethionine synthetase
MELNLVVRPQRLFGDDYEVIEIKGRGHPDTLSDALAEYLSQCYSQYTREHFGAILRHNFDKVGLLGGKASVAFGSGRMVAPVRILLNGRASPRFADEEIDLEALLDPACRRFLVERLPKLDPERDLLLLNNLSSGSSPGHVRMEHEAPGSRKHWFEPRSLADIRELRSVASNDTSVGCGYAPFSLLESFVLGLERHLTGAERLAAHPWQGTDIKIMAVRVARRVRLTMCVPQIADHVPDLNHYREHLDEVRAEVLARAHAGLPDHDVTLAINTKDDFERPELYLTATGSSIESGDEGLVGRGNRANGLIAMCRPFNMEGAAGKNPIYHVGKVYNVAAQRIAERIHAETGHFTIAWLVSQEGRLLADPWEAIVETSEPIAADVAERVIGEVMAELPRITEDLVSGAIRVF